VADDAPDENAYRSRRRADDDDLRPRRYRDDDDDFDRPRRRQKSSTGLIIGLAVGGGLLVIAVIVLIVLIGTAAKSLPGTTWVGHETLPGFGRLEFQFQRQGKCLMIDAKNTVQGKYTHSGDRVTITFANAVYEGTINGDNMSGTARPVGGFGPGFGLPPNWTWNAKRK
jgi:hypothetical protein